MLFFAQWQGLYLQKKHWRDPIFAFAFEGALFVFALTKPALAPLFALPPTSRVADKQPYFFSKNKYKNFAAAPPLNTSGRGSVLRASLIVDRLR